MADARAIIDGTPGSYFVNETEKPLYQLHAAGIFTCALCWSYDGKLARFWPIPLHPRCRCRQSVCKPGQQAKEPFVDWQAKIRDLPPDQQTAAMGKSLYRLWTKGVVPIEAIVTPGRVRSLQEVTSRQRLSVEQMVKAGVNPRIAAEAHAAVHTPEHVAVAAHRKELLAKIHGAGVGHEMVVKHIGERIASRVVVAPGPSYTTKTATAAGPAGTVIPGIQGGHLIDAAAMRQRHADELKALLSKSEIAKAALKKRPAMPQKKTDPIEAARDAQRAANAAQAAATPVIHLPQTTSEQIRLYGRAIDKARDDIAQLEKDAIDLADRWKEFQAEADKYKAKAFDYNLTKQTRDKWLKKLESLRNNPEYDRAQDAVRYGPDIIKSKRDDIARWEVKIRDERANLKPEVVEYARLQKAHPDLLPPGHIADRIGQYQAGDAKVKAVIQAAEATEKLENNLAIKRGALNKQIDALQNRGCELLTKDPTTRTPAENAEIQAIQDRLHGMCKKLDLIKQGQKAIRDKRVFKALEIDPADRIAFKAKDADPGANYNGPLSPMSAETQKNAEKATGWLSRHVARGDGTFAASMDLKIGERAGSRAHWDSNDPGAKYNILAKPGQGVDVIVHEFGHGIDAGVLTGNDNVLKRSLEFLDHRLKGQKPIELKSKFPWYDPGEKGSDDDFGKVFDSSSAYYVGKDYNRKATEIVSMGVQQMYNDPVKFAKNDPEYFKFVAGIMDGSLR